MALLYFSLHTHIQVKLNVVCEGRFVGYQTIRAHLQCSKQEPSEVTGFHSVAFVAPVDA